MFIFHIAETLSLLALASGVALYVWGVRMEGKGRGLAQFFGGIVMVLAILSVLCTSYYGISYWTQARHGMMMTHGSMCPCMHDMKGHPMMMSQPEKQTQS